MEKATKLKGKKPCNPNCIQQEPEDTSGRFKLPKEEKKARRVLSQLNMIPMTGFTRVVMRRTDNTLIVIDEPELYKPPNCNTYIVFGVPRCQEPLEHAQEAAAQRFKIEDFLQQAVQSDELTSDSDDEIGNGNEPAEGVSENDIDILISQCNVSRKKAIKTLKRHDNDLVNAIMALTV